MIETLPSPASTAATFLDVAELTRDIWAAFVAVEARPVVDVGGAVADETLTGCVHIAGAWEGTVFVEVSRAHAEHAAARMFAAPVGTLGADEVCDALGELTNIVAGNVKGVLGVQARLSLPQVAFGASYTLRVTGTALRESVRFDTLVGPLRVSVWELCD